VRALLAALLSLVCASAQAGDLSGTIYWMSHPQGSAYGAPMTSSYYVPCMKGVGAYAVQVSICPGMGAGGRGNPYELGHLVRIKSCQATQILSDPTATGYFVIGSGGTIPDVFCSGGGVGTNRTDHPMPFGLIQGAGRYIDVYAAVDKGTQQMIVVLEYEDAGVP
jgi:hypothetical protein